MEKDKSPEEISHTEKLDDVIRQKKAESNALKKLIASLEISEKEESPKKIKH